MAYKKVSEEQKAENRKKSNENLKSFNKMDKEKHKAVSSKGGKNSQILQHEKRNMKMMLSTIMESPNESPEIAKALQKLGFSGNDNIHMAKTITALVRKAEDGDLKAVELIAKMLYGDEQNNNVNMSGELETKSRVQIYLPEIEKDEDDD